MNPFKQPVFKILAILVFGAAAAGASAADTAMTADVTALQGLQQSWVQAYNAGDANAITEFYADDATLMPPGAPSTVGKDAIRTFFVSDLAEAQHAGYIMNLKGTLDGGVAGDWGWLSGGYTVMDKAGHQVDGGKFLAIYGKVEGKWYLLRDTWSSDQK